MRFAFYRQSQLPNWQPDRQAARSLIKRRLIYYCLVVSALTLAGIITVLLVWFLNSKENASRLGLALVVAQLLLTGVCYGFWDMGPASLMRRNKFKSKHSQNTRQVMHTFYYVLRVSGGYRLLFNLLILTMIAAVALCAYLA